MCCTVSSLVVTTAEGKKLFLMSSLAENVEIKKTNKTTKTWLSICSYMKRIAEVGVPVISAAVFASTVEVNELRWKSVCSQHDL